MKLSNYTGFFLCPERKSMGRAVVNAKDTDEAKAEVMRIASEIYSCGTNEITLLLLQRGEVATPVFNTELERGNV